MKIELETREDHQIQVIAEFEPEVFEKYKRQAIRTLSTKTRIPGFRPGKAPVDVVKRLVGEKAIQEQAIEILIDEQYPNVIKEAQIDPYGPGSLENIVSEDPLTLSFIVPLAPKVTLGDYKTIRLEYAPEPVTEKEVNKVIERLQYGYAVMEPVDRPAQENDMVFLNMDARFVNPAEGENEVVFDKYPMQSRINTNEDAEEWPFPGFSKELAGLSSGDEKVFSHSFGDEATNDKWKSKEISFKVNVQSIKMAILPTMNEEFLATLGNFKTEEELRSSIQHRMEHDKLDEYDEMYYVRLIDLIRDSSTVKYPPFLLEDEMKHVLESVTQDLANQKMDLDTYIKLRKLEKESFMDTEIKPVAVRRLETSLIMDEIASAENLRLNQEELAGIVSQTMVNLEQQSDFKRQTRGLTMDQRVDLVARQTASRMISRQVLDKLKAIASGKGEEENQEPVAAANGEEAQPPTSEETPEVSETEKPSEE